MNDKRPVNPIDKTQRIRILERDDYTCTCGFQGESGQGPHGIQVHHIVPRSAGGDNEDDKLKSQCGVCHTKLDAELRKHENGNKRMSLAMKRGARKKVALNASVDHDVKQDISLIVKRIKPIFLSQSQLINYILKEWIEIHKGYDLTIGRNGIQIKGSEYDDS